MDQSGLENVPENSKVLELLIERLKSEKKQLQDEFNVQRAKLKDLYLQKEAELQRKTEENLDLSKQVSKLNNELDDCKSQLVVDSITLESNLEVEKRKAAEEIATLQRLVHETIEESSSTRTLYDDELAKLQSYIQQLQKEITDLKHEKNQSPHHLSQEHSSLAPSQVLNVLTKGLKKLGESIDVDSKKQSEKETGDQSSQKHVQLDATTSTNTSFESQKLFGCDMCSNYEAELVKEQKKTSDLQARVIACEKAAERHKEELLKEIGFRKEMEEKWNEKKEEHKQQVAELTRATECTEQDLKELRQHFNKVCSDMKITLGRLTHEREMIHHELQRLQKENANLIGKYTICSQELQSQMINLPDTIEELHELLLKTHQELIMEKIGKEAAEQTVNTLQSEISLLKDRITNDQQERKGMEESLDLEIKALRKQIDQLDKEKRKYLLNQEKLANAEKSNNDIVTDQKKRIEELSEIVKTLESQNTELKTRVSSLQQELDTTETVQKDFVRLSQSLQVQLEKIRESDTQVRWQHEEDVEECPSCRTGFSSSRKKMHCRHCGQIFCVVCLTRTVMSGPNSRPSKVCDVCHTLLVKSSAPYFSEAPPTMT
ncbi:unnamed protein product [Acanthoscelides obtectus]|uniref:Rab GTPase-binding effector protein 1 n=1 Tax=Acanthoscelides obtectus TaxID=200917 RepID=A0A9P0KF82_ACAOB|nr:unnamed protein product [Acanthoscelides obtectus]CAK1651000.1 Rab GTPase-binding effector protein 1 [Acanthoscelides obtectus]